MLLLRNILLILLAVASSSLAASYNDGKEGGTFWIAKPEKANPGMATDSQLVRFARSLSPELTKELGETFNAKSLLSFLQQSIKLAAPVAKTVSNVIPADAIKDGIQHLRFPGRGVVATVVSDFFRHLHDLLEHVIQSDFVRKEPSEQNLYNLALDLLIVILEHWVKVTAQLEGGLEVAFDSDNPVYDGLRNSDFNKPFFQQHVKDAHDFISRLVKGLLKLTSPLIRRAIEDIINQSKLPTKVGDILKEAIETLNRIVQDISKTKFIKEAADFSNVHELIVVTMKSIAIHGLGAIRELGELILYALYKFRGVDKTFDVSHVEAIAFEKGLALNIINTALQWLSNVNLDEGMSTVHKFMKLATKVTLEVTGGSAMIKVPEYIIYIGEHLTDLLAKASGFFIEQLHAAALMTSQSKFITDPPTWQNALEYAKEVVKRSLKSVNRFAEKGKQHYESEHKDSLAIPRWIVDLMEPVFPPPVLQKVQEISKSIVEGIVSVTGDRTQELIDKLIGSEIPFADALAKILSNIVGTINKDGARIAGNKFFTQSPTVESGAELIVEVFNAVVSSVLQLVADITDDVSKIIE